MVKKPTITVFTPTYNRAHTLPRLYASLLKQGDRDTFEWLIIDDCSLDNTSSVIEQWIKDAVIHINYIRLNKNIGKPRAINLATTYARSPYLFIVDSDDYLVDDIITFLISELPKIDNERNINGLGVLRVHQDGKCFAKPTFEHSIDATNIDRSKYGLDVDCNEVYKISILKQYPFEVWPGEKFTPESTVLNAMSLDGYKIRWFNKTGVVSEYQEDGLTKGSWILQKRNPMGYAMLYNCRLQYDLKIIDKLSSAMRFGAQCLLGKNPSYLCKTNAPLLTVLMLPFSIALFFRRQWQYRSV